MPFDIQVVVDSAAPHELADWWAAALGWQVEPQDEAFIRRMVAAGDATEADPTTRRGALVWKVGAAITSPEPGRPRVLFQAVPESRTVKNRLHLDVRGGAARRAAGGGTCGWAPPAATPRSAGWSPRARGSSTARRRARRSGSPWPTRRATS